MVFALKIKTIVTFDKPIKKTELKNYGSPSF